LRFTAVGVLVGLLMTAALALLVAGVLGAVSRRRSIIRQHRPRTGRGAPR
jgi:hypothetical protein